MGCIDWFIYGEVDWERWQTRLRQYCPVLAGALFGAGWWCWVDAIVYSSVVLHESFPFTYHLPGWVATLALILMNVISRDDLNNISDSYGDEHASTRARLWLFFSYIVAFSAVAGSVAVLVTCTKAQEHLWVGVGGLLQTGSILASALLLWAFRSSESSDGYGGIGY